MKVAVLGSGNGGCTAAADMSLIGHQVSVWDFKEFPLNIEAISKKGGIKCEGDIEGFAKVQYAGFDIQKATEGAEMILVVSPAYGTEKIAKELKPYLQTGQTVCVCPSSGAGAIIFKRALGLDLEDPRIIVSEVSTLPYATRVSQPGEVNVYIKLRGGLYFAAIPGKKSQDAFEKFKQLYPHSEHAKSLLKTMLQTGNTIIHPSVTLLNAGRIEDTNGDFYFYENGATPAVGHLMKALDDEKIALSNKLDIGLERDIIVKVKQGYNQEESYESGYRTAEGFKGIAAQKTLDTRYMHEDVGYGLVFLSELSKQFGVKTPISDAIIDIASVVMGRDYRKEKALTPESLGIDKFTVDDMRQIFGQS